MESVDRKFLCKRNNETTKPSKFKLNYNLYNSVPTSFDFSANLPPPYDQGSLGSCASNAGALAYKFNYQLIDPSRLFLYFNARTLEDPNNQYIDSGSTVADVMLTLKNIGICSESLWPYDISNFTQKPPQNCYDEASNNKILNPINLNQDLNTFKSILAQSKPIVFGMLLCENIMQLTADNPVYNGTGNVLGGHALAICGYDDSTQLFKVQNSWGSNWCQGGRFYIPYGIVLNSSLSWDFWCINN